jgi:hypothetical protein
VHTLHFGPNYSSPEQCNFNSWTDLLARVDWRLNPCIMHLFDQFNSRRVVESSLLDQFHKNSLPKKKKKKKTIIQVFFFFERGREI